jgi:hypothetical protein
MLNTVSVARRIPWDIYPVQDEWKVNVGLYPNNIMCSQELLDSLISNYEYRLFRYYDPSSKKYKMGYGYTDPDHPYGATEAEAYADWVEEVKKKESLLQKQLPVYTITQARFDALLSLYVQTGDWRKVKGEEGTYDILTAIKGNRWLLIADMIANGNDRSARIKEARIMQLGSYSTTPDRTRLRGAGLQYTRTQYIRGISDPFAKKQAEYAYYRQTNGAFLPNISESRKRQIVNLVG